ncbi:MAG: fibrillarin-like rRNA/tRNA 2'-O-methyltransferase [Candidatus Hodarchaeales archaeon]|jgi:fibrillarin-like pre-rRNA processing protein
MKIKSHYLNGVFFLDIPTESRIWPATINNNPGKTVYNERLFKQNNIEYRTWDPYKSKLAACIFEQMKEIPDLVEMERILYLGAATGTTVSHISDIISNYDCKILALEFSTRVARRLIQLSQSSQSRSNIVPIIADARSPSNYASLVWSVDFIFQDISQINQAQIFIDNVQTFLKPGNKSIFVIKAHSIDSTRPVDDVANEQIDALEKSGLKIEEVLDISNFEKAHRAILISK